MKNPLWKRLPRELRNDFGKYIVIYLIVAKIIQKGCKEVLKKNLNKAEIKIKQVSDCAYAAFTAFQGIYLKVKVRQI